MFLHCRNDFHFRTNSSLQIQHQRCFDLGAGNSSTTSSITHCCRSPLANQMRLILHTGAYWLLLDLRAAIPSWNPLRHTEFATIRLCLLKIASRIIERASRIRIALASCCPEAETFSLVALKLQPSGP